MVQHDVWLTFNNELQIFEGERENESVGESGREKVSVTC